MSIIIHGMDMPKNEELWIRVQPDGNIVSQTGYVIEDASAKQIPPHGRLIDAAALLQEAKEQSGPQTGDGWDNWGVYALIERQKTVIESEGVKAWHRELSLGKKKRGSSRPQNTLRQWEAGF